MTERNVGDAAHTAAQGRSITAPVTVRPEPPPYSAETLKRLGVQGLHCGSGVNLHAGWLNTDILRIKGSNGVESVAERIATCGDAFYLQHDATTAHPVEDESIVRVLAEHFIEHLPMPLAVAWLAEMRRVLVRGGIIRISTPDLEKYVRGYLRAADVSNAKHTEKAAQHTPLAGQASLTTGLALNEPVPDERFFEEHRRRLSKVCETEIPARRAWMMNQIFYGWAHCWLYDREEIVCAAVLSGFARDDVHFASFRRGMDSVMAELDLPIRNDESLYVDFVKR